MALIPRDYQIEAADVACKSLKGKGRGIVVCPVGSGKTLIFSLVAKKLGEPLLVIAHNQELVSQNYNASVEMGVKGCTIYCTGLDQKDSDGQVVFCTVKSAKANPELFKKFKYAIIDECDQQFPTKKDSEYHKFFKAMGLKNYIGFTGTPITTSRTQMGNKIKLIHRQRPSNFSTVEYHLPNSTMIDKGYWSKLEYINYKFDGKELKRNSTGMDFTDVSIKQALESQSINNNGYVLIKRLLAEKKTGILLFCHSLKDAEVFNKNIPNSAVVSYKTKKKDRKIILESFKDGEIDVLINLNCLKAGFNFPGLEYIITLRPLGSIRDWIQICGRGVRVAKGKKSCKIIDFAGNIDRYGRIEDIDIRFDGVGYQLYSGEVLLSGIFTHDIGRVKFGDKVQPEDLGSKFEHFRMPHGKYAGRPLKGIPRYYMDWMLTTDNCIKEVREYMK